MRKPKPIMFPEIDVEKSIERGRLSYKVNFNFIFNFIFNGLVIIAFSFAAAFFVVRQFTQEIYSSIIYCFCLISFYAWMISNFILMNKLIKIKGKGIEFNRKKILEVISADNPDLTNELDRPDCIVQVYRGGALSSGYALTLLFSGDMIYINRTAFGRGDMLSPFHATYCYYRCKDLVTALQIANPRTPGAGN